MEQRGWIYKHFGKHFAGPLYSQKESDLQDEVVIRTAAEDDAMKAVVEAAKRLSVVEVGSINNRIEHLTLIKALDALAELEGK